jgi:hypothetical protein
MLYPLSYGRVEGIVREVSALHLNQSGSASRTFTCVTTCRNGQVTSVIARANPAEILKHK